MGKHTDLSARAERWLGDVEGFMNSEGMWEDDDGAMVADIVAGLQREAEHLRDMLHCTQRVVNLLVAARHVAENLAHHRDAHEHEWDHSHRIYMAQTEGVLRDAIAREEMGS